VRQKSFSGGTTAAMGKPKPPHCSLGGGALAALRKVGELLGDQIDRVDPLAGALEAVLAKPATHMNQVALDDVLVNVGLDLREDDAEADRLTDLIDGPPDR
jgi:hypothetical protein